MRLQELFEDVYSADRIDYESTEDLVDKVVGYIEDNCRPWLEAAESKFVYRGVRHVSKAFTRRVRQDRLPANSAEEIHDLFNGLIAMVGGVANRSNSAFVTSDRGETLLYGDPYIVFPVGPFNYTWSPRWSDWYTDLMRTEEGRNELISLMHLELSKQFWALDSESAEYFRLCNELIPKVASYDPAKIRRCIYADRGLNDAIKSGHEIMIACDTVLYLDPIFYRTDIRKYF